MKKVLFYVEPHPIRNYFSEFTDPGMLFYEIASHTNFTDIDWRVFSNSFVLDEMIEKVANNEEGNDSFYSKEKDSSEDTPYLDKISDKFIYPGEDDDAKIKSFLREWNENEILTRNDLVLGEGDVSEYYESLLKKIFNRFNFTHVVLWSENGAVRKFCGKKDIHVIHMELGPTRLPFQETIVIDPAGTNANSSLCQCKRPEIKESIDSTLWTTDFSKKNNRAVKEIYLSPGNIIETEHVNGDIYLTTDEDFISKQETKYIDNFVVVSLQLTDDLNTINHSKYNSPQAFLQDILPPLLALGYKVLIKRHPGAIYRIFNLTKEIEAIEYAKSLSDKVYILPATMEQKEFIILSKNARAILSINSSVSFEAWIIGVPGLIFGNAVFDCDNKIIGLSNDFISGGALIEDAPYIESIKENVAFSLNHYFLPKNIFLLSNILSKVVCAYDRKSQPNFIHWLYKEVDIFNILLEEKISDIDNSLAGKAYIDFYNEMANALPNDGFYHYTIDELHRKNKEFLLRGWAISEKSAAKIVFIEYAGAIYFTQMTERADVKNHFPFAAINSGFEIREMINNSDKSAKAFKVYIFGSDNVCRYIEVAI